MQNAAGQIARDIRRVYRSVYEDVSGTNLPPASQQSGIFDRTRAVRAGDVDRDGDLDLLLCVLDNMAGAAALQRLWINNGVGAFTDQSTTRLPAVRQFGCADALLVDVDNDGDLDAYLLSATDTPGNRLWMNNGAGTFSDETSTRLPSGIPVSVGAAAAADVDADGDRDLIATANPPVLLINDGTGRFSNQTAARIPWLTACASCGAEFVDVNRDGRLDFVYNNGVGINDGTGRFSQGQGSFPPFGLSVGDVNGDGYPDVLSSATLYLNNGVGAYTSPGQSLVTNPCVLAGNLADLDVDGDLDAYFTTITNRVTPRCRQQSIVLLNDGLGRFTDQSSLWGFVGTLSWASSFYDTTGEGYPDLILAGFNETTTTLRRARWDEFPPACPGDCSGDGAVTVDELVRAVNILLGNQPITNCRRGDANGNGEITCAEINRGTNNTLNGCPAGGSLSLSATVPFAESAATFAALSNTVTQQIGSASGARGSNVTIPVSVTGGAGAVAATQLDILYPTNVLSNPSCVKASRLTNHSLSTSLPSTPPAPSGKTRLRTLITDLSAASTFTDGQIFSCTFTIKTTAPRGTHRITGERQRVSDSPGNELPAAVTNGSVTVF